MSRQWSQGGVSPTPTLPHKEGEKRPLALRANEKTIGHATSVPYGLGKRIEITHNSIRRCLARTCHCSAPLNQFLCRVCLLIPDCTYPTTAHAGFPEPSNGRECRRMGSTRRRRT